MGVGVSFNLGIHERFAKAGDQGIVLVDLLIAFVGLVQDAVVSTADTTHDSAGNETLGGSVANSLGDRLTFGEVLPHLLLDGLCQFLEQTFGYSTGNELLGETLGRLLGHARGQDGVNVTNFQCACQLSADETKQPRTNTAGRGNSCKLRGEPLVFRASTELLRG